MTLQRFRILLILLATVTALPASAQNNRPTPSGLPVPRWVSLKFNKVYARAGPGEDHRLLWVYRVRRLPVQVVQETADWRRVCDPEGGLAWVHKRTTDGERWAMNIGSDDAPLRAKAAEDSKVKALWRARSLAELDDCRGNWCRVKVGAAGGWAPRRVVWGSTERAVCGAR